VAALRDFRSQRLGMQAMRPASPPHTQSHT
jgi:hypothetical protein